ncbi:MAG: outer membrane protein assembly factor BamD, partial [Ekhidna sp.]
MRSTRFLILLILVVGLAGCSKFRKIMKSGDWKTKYEAAIEYYNAEDYRRATELFEDILPIIRGTAEAEKGNFYIAYCYYHQQQYVLSAYHFQEFVNIYGRSEYVLEASYMNAYSLYLQSPDYELDQTSTYEAIGAMQSFINKYPTSEYAQEADKTIDLMQIKLERKAYETCKLYFKLRRYKSGLVVYENFKNDFPDSNFNEEVAYLNVKTAYDLAKQSIYTKQEERFKTAIEFYTGFVDKYPNSDYLKEA